MTSQNYSWSFQDKSDSVEITEPNRLSYQSVCGIQNIPGIVRSKQHIPNNSKLYFEIKIEKAFSEVGLVAIGLTESTVTPKDILQPKNQTGRTHPINLQVKPA